MSYGLLLDRIISTPLHNVAIIYAQPIFKSDRNEFSMLNRLIHPKNGLNLND